MTPTHLGARRTRQRATCRVRARPPSRRRPGGRFRRWLADPPPDTWYGAPDRRGPEPGLISLHFYNADARLPLPTRKPSPTTSASVSGRLPPGAGCGASSAAPGNNLPHPRSPPLCRAWRRPIPTPRRASAGGASSSRARGRSAERPAPPRGRVPLPASPPLHGRALAHWALGEGGAIPPVRVLPTGGRGRQYGSAGLSASRLGQPRMAAHLRCASAWLAWARASREAAPTTAPRRAHILTVPRAGAIMRRLSTHRHRRCAHASETGSRRRPNVLLIGIDSLRADHMSLYGYRGSLPRTWTSSRGHRVRALLATHPTTSGYARCSPGGTSSQVVALRHKGPMRETSPPWPRSSRRRNCTTSVGEGTRLTWIRHIPELRRVGLGRGRSPKANLNDVAFRSSPPRHDDKRIFLFLRHMDTHAPYLPPTRTSGRSTTATNSTRRTSRWSR